MSLLSNPSDGPYKAVVATGRGRGYHDGHGVDDDGGGRGRGHGKQLEASGDDERVDLSKRPRGLGAQTVAVLQVTVLSLYETGSLAFSLPLPLFDSWRS